MQDETITLTLDDVSIKRVVRNLKIVLESPFFTYNGKTYTKGVVKEHPRRMSMFYYKKRARPMILVDFGVNTIVFYEKDRFQFGLEDVKVMTVKGEKIKISKVTPSITNILKIKEREQKMLDIARRMNNLLERRYISDEEEEIRLMVNEEPF